MNGLCRLLKDALDGDSELDGSVYQDWCNDSQYIMISSTYKRWIQLIMTCLLCQQKVY